MKLDVLKRLQWPEHKDVLAQRNSDIKKYAQNSRGKQQQMPNVDIILDSKRRKYLPFAKLSLWVHSNLKLDKYDSDEIQQLQTVLKLEAPDVAPSVICNKGAMTNVLPLYHPYTLIQPHSTIAFRYTPIRLSTNDNVSSPRHSTIITEFTHHGFLCCLVLEFDLKK